LHGDSASAGKLLTPRSPSAFCCPPDKGGGAKRRGVAVFRAKPTPRSPSAHDPLVRGS
jgi:hypothetical protein